VGYIVLEVVGPNLTHDPHFDALLTCSHLFRNLQNGFLIFSWPVEEQVETLLLERSGVRVVLLLVFRRDGLLLGLR